MISCPRCGAKTRVLETRVTATSARRRRGCTASGCTGKVTTVEVIVPEGRVSALATGSIVVSARLITKLRASVAALQGGRRFAKLREIVAAIEGAAL